MRDMRCRQLCCHSTAMFSQSEVFATACRSYARLRDSISAPAAFTVTFSRRCASSRALSRRRHASTRQRTLCRMRQAIRDFSMLPRCRHACSLCQHSSRFLFAGAIRHEVDTEVPRYAAASDAAFRCLPRYAAYAPLYVAATPSLRRLRTLMPAASLPRHAIWQAAASRCGAISATPQLRRMLTPRRVFSRWPFVLPLPRLALPPPPFKERLRYAVPLRRAIFRVDMRRRSRYMPCHVAPYMCDMASRHERQSHGT